MTFLEKKAAWVECRSIFQLAWPIMLTYVLELSLQIINTLIVGHLGARELAAASLGSMWTNCTGISVATGMATAVGTLGAQAFGARKFERVGIVTLRGAFFLTLLGVIPMSIIWIFAGKILTHLGQEEATVALSQGYIRYLLIGLWPVVMFEVLKRFLQTENKVLFPLVSATLGVCCNAVVGYLLVHKSPLGFIGAPLATSIAQWLMFLSLLLYIRIDWKSIVEITQEDFDNCQQIHVQEGPISGSRRSLSHDYVLVDSEGLPQSICPMSSSSIGDHDDEESDALITGTGDSLEETDRSSVVIGKTWTGWHFKEAFQGWREFAALAFPGAAQTSLEWGAFEVLSLMAGIISTDTLATHSILSLTANISFCVPLGISIAASVRVGHGIGDERISDAKRTSVVGALMGFVYSAFNVAFVFSVKNFWGTIFTNDATVKSMVASYLPLMALFNFVDAQQCVLAGVMRGLGKQNLGAIFNFAAYWIVGLPTAYALAIVASLELPGIWYGETIGASVATACQILYLKFKDWEQISRLTG